MKSLAIAGLILLSAFFIVENFTNQSVVSLKDKYYKYLETFGKVIPSGEELEYRIQVFASNLA